MAPPFKFQITHEDDTTQARCGLLQTPHGSIETPNFIFCATKGALKGVTSAQAREAGVDIILSNTYHMMLQPGADLVAQHGGLHTFLDWEGPMLTDSGGFQIFSLNHGGVADEIKGRRRFGGDKQFFKITEEGAFFHAYTDGSPQLLTPEISIQVQHKLGADLVVVLDECTPFHANREYTARSMEMSHRWGLRSLREFERLNNGSQALYGIVQGGIYPDLRKISAAFVNEQPFFGQAIGGTLGSDKEQMYEVVRFTRKELEAKRPTHLLGIGGVNDIWEGVAQGIDTFDCTHPTRIARHGRALVRSAMAEGQEGLNLKNARFREDLRPIDDQCPCYGCRKFTRAYIHHLLKANEMLGGQLLTLHNMTFMMQVAQTIRASIKENRFLETKKEWIR